MKRFIIVLYYNFVFWLEEITGAFANIFFQWRVNIDEKYWEKYIRPSIRWDKE
jgi:hypothetical protein